LFAVNSKRALLIVAACLPWSYLIVADGGTFPGAERFLPTEWLLDNRTTQHTYFGNGLKLPKSLAMWTWRECVYSLRDKPGPDPSPKTESLTVDLFQKNNPASTLPKFTFVTVTTTVTITNRFYPENKPLFLIAHCWFATLMALLILISILQRTASQSLSLNESL
jgi:hypothetical protein